MAQAHQMLRMYEDLAYKYDREGQARLRDCYLVLAADAAYDCGMEDEAERLRTQLLSFNPHHLLRPYVSFADAMRSPDIRSYIADLRRNRANDADAQDFSTTFPTDDEPVEKPLLVPKSPPRPQNGHHDKPEVYQINRSESPKPAPKPARPEPPRPKPRVQVTPPVPAPRKQARQRPETPRASATQKRKTPSYTYAPSAAQSEIPDEPSAGNWWFTMFLFVLMLLLGLGLAGYTLLKPFIPQEWLM